MMRNPVVSALVWFVSGAWTCHWALNHFEVYDSNGTAVNLLAMLGSGIVGGLLGLYLARLQKSG